MLTLNYKEFGEGRPVLILHGLFGSARNWQGFARELSSKYRVITPDMRNHGQSFHADSMGYQDMADDVLHLIEKLQLSEPIIIGHSMGGKVAMTIALSKPKLASGMIVVDIAPVSYDHDFDDVITAMEAVSKTSIRNRKEAESIMAAELESQNLINFILQNLVRKEDTFEWRVNVEQIITSMPELVAFPASLEENSSHVPTLFIGGANSSYIKSIHNPAIFHHFPAAEIKVIEGGGHWVHADKPEEFLQTVLSFLQEI